MVVLWSWSSGRDVVLSWSSLGVLVRPWCPGRLVLVFVSCGGPWSCSLVVSRDRVRGSWSSGVVFRGCARLRGPLGGNSKAVVFCLCLAAIFVVCSFLFLQDRWSCKSIR